jgi:hypothetical protein
MKLSSFARTTLLKVPFIRYYIAGKKLLSDPYFQECRKKDLLEKSKKPSRTEIINYLLSLKTGKTTYLEIGVRDPSQNFDHIKASTKYSVDPGLEFKQNPATFKVTSDEFFKQLQSGSILTPDCRFDVIFIDGLHVADQVDGDIRNSLNFIKADGFIVLHDCNPPTESHTRAEYSFINTPAYENWNGTTWKAFVKWRYSDDLTSCCVDTDWGVGIISKKTQLGSRPSAWNEFYDYYHFDQNRKHFLNLVSFSELKTFLEPVSKPS